MGLLLDYTDSPNIWILNGEILEEAVRVSKKGMLIFKIFGTSNKTHGPSARIKIYFSHSSPQNGDITITLSEVDPNNLVLFDCIKPTNFDFRSIKKEQRKVLEQMFIECKDNFIDFYNDRISETELINILKSKFPNYVFNNEA